MREILQQLATMGPGIAAGLKGNGNAMKEFMDAFQRTSAQLEEQKRMQQQTQMQGEDRQLALADRKRGIARQGEADARATEDQGWQNQQRLLSLSQLLNQSGANAESLPEAEGGIDSTFGLLTPEQQAKLAPARDQALIGAQRTITGRQKKQVEAYVEAALKTSFVADNPDSDPELVQLPEHIAKILGKPVAKLSELQQFAQLPVGKPQGKTRVPAMGGSFEDYMAKAYGENPTPAQILQGRKDYNQSDDRAPRVTVNTGDKVDRGAALKFQDDYARDSKPYIQLRDAYQRVTAAKPDAAGDLSLIFAYMKILDPNSVVREQEFANAQNAAGVPDRIRNLYNQTMEGVRLNPEQRRQFVSQAEALFANARKNQKQVRGTYSSRAKQWGIPEAMILDDDPMLADAPPQQKPDGAAPQFIVAVDPQGNVHHAPAGTPLPAGWKLKQ